MKTNKKKLKPENQINIDFSNEFHERKIDFNSTDATIIQFDQYRRKELYHKILNRIMK